MKPHRNQLIAHVDRWLTRLHPRLVSWAEPRYQIGPSLFRVLFGAFAIYQLLINYAQRGYLFGPEGVWPYGLFRAEVLVSHSFSLYAWSHSRIWFELVYHVHVVVAALWLLGFGVRLLTPLLWVLHWSIHERFGLLWDGGDNMGYLLLLYLCFADVGHHFAPLGRPRPAFNPSKLRHLAGGLLHNAALLACTLQICILYFNAGVAKLDGQYWQNGTALYYSLRAAEYAVNPGIARLVWDNSYLLFASTYGTLLFQLSFPWVILFGTRFLRVAIVLVAVSFHLGILTLMGLVTFGLFMLAYEPLLLRDDEYRAMAAWLRLGQWTSLASRWSRQWVHRPRDHAAADTTSRVTVIPAEAATPESDR